MEIKLTEDGVRISSANNTLTLVWDEYRQLKGIILSYDYEPIEN